MSFDVIVMKYNCFVESVCVCVSMMIFLKKEMSHQTRKVLKNISVVNDHNLEIGDMD